MDVLIEIILSQYNDVQLCESVITRTEVIGGVSKNAADPIK